MPSSDASCAVCDLRRHERVAERALELRSDFDNTDPRARLDPDRVARGEVGTGRVRAHDLLIGKAGPFDRGSARKAAVRRHRFDLDHAGALPVQETGMRDVPDPPDPVAVPDLLVQARAANLPRSPLGLSPAVPNLEPGL